MPKKFLQSKSKQISFSKIKQINHLKIKKVVHPKKPTLTLAERQEKKLKIQKERQRKKKELNQDSPKNKERFYCTNKELLEELIKWRDSSENIEDRVISERFGKMLMTIAKKVLNHSNFRNYSRELKEDMASFFYYKVIKGLKNYNFKFTNPFAFFTMCAFNSFLSVIIKHYKHVDLKKAVIKCMVSELKAYSKMAPDTSIIRYMENYMTNYV